MEPKKLKRMVIKEELVALTGDFKLAIVLNQMIYWAEKRNDADKFIEEERDRYNKYSVSASDSPNIEISHGWIYKKAEELAEETMIGVSKKTMLNYLDTLTQKGWLHRRRNPKLAMDKTYQYRVDLVAIQKDLLSLGYSLDGYSIGTTKLQNENSENTGIRALCSKESPKYCDLPFETSTGKNETSTGKNETPRVKNETPRVKNETAIPEITTEITTKITKQKENDDEAFYPAKDLGAPEGAECDDEIYVWEIPNQGKDDPVKILLKYDIVLSEKNPATRNCLERLKQYTPEQIEVIGRVLSEKEAAGKIKNAAGLIVQDPRVCQRILEGKFYPEYTHFQNNKQKLLASKEKNEEYEIYIPPTMREM